MPGSMGDTKDENKNGNPNEKPKEDQAAGKGPSSQGNSSGVPLYHQWDERWANHPYDGGGGETVASSGCGPTCFAMVCSWYGKNVTPDIAADDFKQNGHRVPGQGTGHTAFQDRGPAYGVDFQYTNDPQAVRDALKNGMPVIAAHGEGKFTGGGHYILYAKLDDQGLIINDPNQGGSRNKTGDDYHWDLEEVLSDGGVCDWWIPTTPHNGVQPNFNAQSQSEGGSGPMGAINKAKGPANNTFGGGSGYVEINPKKKTYCEPVYPDLIYVQGNIPNTAVEDTVVNGMDNMSQAGDYGIMTSQGMQDLLGMDGSAFTTDEAQRLAQRQFDPSNCIQEVKVPNAGKPLNNNDPYPVDLKIEELEKHMPRIKQYKLPYNKQHLETKALAEAILKLSDFTEKRIVKLENILATVMRYTFGMGKRMHINCQYYGGQDHRSKYVCIRCLKDNLLEDGAVVQIDQCLSCSRYEPIIGQNLTIIIF